jgi:hypothetical protein
MGNVAGEELQLCIAQNSGAPASRRKANGRLTRARQCLATGRYTGRGMTNVQWRDLLRDLNTKLRHGRPHTMVGMTAKLEQLVRCYSMVERDRTGHNNDLWDPLGC